MIWYKEVCDHTVSVHKYSLTTVWLYDAGDPCGPWQGHWTGHSRHQWWVTEQCTLHSSITACAESGRSWPLSLWDPWGPPGKDGAKLRVQGPAAKTSWTHGTQETVCMEVAYVQYIVSIVTGAQTLWLCANSSLSSWLLSDNQNPQ